MVTLHWFLVAIWLTAAVLFVTGHEDYVVLTWFGVLILLVVIILARRFVLRRDYGTQVGLGILLVQIAAFGILMGSITWRRIKAYERKHFLESLNTAGKIEDLTISRSRLDRLVLDDFDLEVVKLRDGHFTREDVRRIEYYFPEAHNVTEE